MDLSTHSAVHRDVLRVASPLQDAPLWGSCGTIKLVQSDGKLVPLEEIQRLVIKHSIGHLDGQMSETARQLRIGRSTLYRYLDVYNLQPSPPTLHFG